MTGVRFSAFEIWGFLLLPKDRNMAEKYGLLLCRDDFSPYIDVFLLNFFQCYLFE